jgi:hypothetical protein
VSILRHLLLQYFTDSQSSRSWKLFLVFKLILQTRHCFVSFVVIEGVPLRVCFFFSIAWGGGNNRGLVTRSSLRFILVQDVNLLIQKQKTLRPYFLSVWFTDRLQKIHRCLTVWSQIQKAASVDAAFCICEPVGIKNWKSLVEEIRLFSEFHFKITTTL